jgi:signal transduction histidine kinase
MSTWHTRSGLDLGREDGRSAAARKTTGPPRAGHGDATPGRRRRHARRLSDRQAVDTPNATEALFAEETRRVAADVHDLVMQDLCFALASARALEDDPEVAWRASTIVIAAERALAGAREVLSGLSSQDRKPVIEAVRASVKMAARDAALSFDAAGVPDGAEPDQVTLCALVHIAREAVTNAVKHGVAAEVAVVLEYGEQWRLRVGDTGCGFDPAAQRSGFGLDSMSTHADALGGLLRVASVPGQGTILEVLLP